MVWNDIEWPDGGKGPEDFGVAALLRRYFQAVPDGVVNDRWGVPYHGHLTREYTRVEDIQDEVWESTRGLGYSFGYNQAEDESASLSGADLITMFVDVVSKNGNLLINVGPRADGSIPELQRRSMRELGAWLKTNGHGIYTTRPWIRCSEPTGVPRAYTTSRGRVHVHVLDPTHGTVELPAELSDPVEARWADGTAADVAGGVAIIPDALRKEPTALLSVRP